MKKILYFIGIALFAAMSACGSKESNENAAQSAANDSIAEIDSLQLVLNQIDSLTAKGNLIHLDSYEIGKIKSVSVLVNKIQTESDSFSMIIFRKDCGGEYYYSWEEATLLKQEVKPFLEAINQIRENSQGETDHKQIYAYVTRDNIRFSSQGLPSGWTFEFSVDIHKSNSTISLSKSDIETLINLINSAETKIREIE